MAGHGRSASPGEGVLLTTTTGDKIRLTGHVDRVEASRPKFLVKQKNDAKHPGFLVTDTEPARPLQQRLEKCDDVWGSVVIEPAPLLSRQFLRLCQLWQLRKDSAQVDFDDNWEHLELLEFGKSGFPS